MEVFFYLKGILLDGLEFGLFITQIIWLQKTYIKHSSRTDYLI